MKEGDVLDLKETTATQRFSHHPARYTEASLVKKLEELGIGRPSTYAPTISTVQKRNYVEKTDREGTSRNYTQFVFDGNTIKKETKTENAKISLSVINVMLIKATKKFTLKIINNR